jgi:hypothetical protein
VHFVRVELADKHIAILASVHTHTLQIAANEAAVVPAAAREMIRAATVPLTLAKYT